MPVDIRYGFLVVPSAVSRHSWNLVFKPDMAAGCYALLQQEEFAFDPGLQSAGSKR
jgi:RES domain-containing protein